MCSVAVFAQVFQSGKLNCGTHCNMFFVKWLAVLKGERVSLDEHQTF